MPIEASAGHGDILAIGPGIEPASGIVHRAAAAAGLPRQNQRLRHIAAPDGEVCRADGQCCAEILLKAGDAIVARMPGDQPFSEARKIGAVDPGDDIAGQEAGAVGGATRNDLPDSEFLSEVELVFHKAALVGFVGADFMQREAGEHFGLGALA